MTFKTKMPRLVLILLLFWHPPLYAKNNPSFSYKVVAVLDGDTFIATDGHVQFRVRIAAMDAPERGQAYGKMAKYRLEAMLKSKVVRIKLMGNGYDKYGRVLGNVFLGEQDIALLMIQEGLATYYRPSCHDYPEDKKKYNYDPEKYVEAEKVARKLQKNIWSASQMMLPCQYRQKENGKRE